MIIRGVPQCGTLYLVIIIDLLYDQRVPHKSIDVLHVWDLIRDVSNYCNPSPFSYVTQ